MDDPRSPSSSSRSLEDVIPLHEPNQRAHGELAASSLVSFRPYEEQTVPRARGASASGKPLEINLGAHKIVYKTELTKPTATQASYARPPPLRKQKSYAPASAHLLVQGRSPVTSSPSSASAVGSVTASAQSQRSQVERQIGKILGAPSDSGDLGEHWMPDHLCHECSECGAKFGIFTRRHHCRICGRIFCHQCSSSTIPARFLRPGLTGNLRVCQQCFHMFNDKRSGEKSLVEPTPTSASSASSSVAPAQQDVASSLLETEPTATPSFTPSRSSRGTWEAGGMVSGDPDPLMASPSRHSMLQAIEFDNPTPHRRSSARHSINDENILALAEDEVEYQLQEIWEKLRDPSHGLIFQTHRHRLRIFHQSVSAPEIVEWLVRHGHAYSRDMAIRIGQALVDTKCLKVVSSAEQMLRDHHHIFLEVGEAGDIASYNRPMVLDAPNWFLSEEGEESVQSLPSMKHGHCGAVQEAQLNAEMGSASFHSRRSSEGKQKLPLQQPLASTEVSHRSRSLRRELSTQAEHGMLGSPVDADGASPGHAKSSSSPIKNLPSPSSSLTSYSILDQTALLRALPMFATSRLSEATNKYSSNGSVRKEILSTLRREYQTHFNSLLEQLVKTHGLSLKWINVIHPLVMDACQKVHTHVFPNDFMDIRHYVKVKKVPGGQKEACSFVSGVVFSKHVTHKKMTLSLRSPRILLLKCPFEFQRRADRLSSFDTLLSQEQEYLRNLVERVKKFQPSVILVQKSVSRFALELLHRCGIVVVVNVKHSVMQRMARSTQGDLLVSLDQLSFKETRLGTCGHFYVKTFTLPDGVRKTLMYFDDCEPKLGGVIMLQGAERHELKKVKEVANFALYAMNNLRMECSFLADEFAQPLTSVPDQTTGDEDYCTPPSSPDLSLFPFSLSVKVTSSSSEKESEEALENASLVTALDEAEDNTRASELEDTLTNTMSVCSDENLQEPGVTKETNTCKEEVGIPVDDSAIAIEAADEIVMEDVDTETVADPSIEDGRQEKPATPPPQPTPEAVFGRMIESQLVSISPHVSFPTPYLQTERGMSASTRCYLPRVIYWSHQFQPRPAKTSPPCRPVLPTPDARTRSSFRTRSFHSDHPSQRHGYKSVSTHPFTSCKFLLPSDSNERKAMVADFRARAALPDEPDCFFFPSARAGADVYAQLAKIFSRSREFEMKAEGIAASAGNLPNGPSSGADLEERTIALHQRAKRWVCPEKEPYPSSSSSSSTLSGELLRIDHVSLTAASKLGSGAPFKQSKESAGLQLGLTEVLEVGNPSPEPQCLPSVEDKTMLPPDLEWDLLTNEEILPNIEQRDCLDPYNHQFLSIMFSSTCHDGQKHLYPCVMPCIIPMSYYGHNDITLGEFLQRYCFRHMYTCQSCDTEMTKHQRHFLHGALELRVSVDTLPTPVSSSSDARVHTWLFCSHCSDAPSTPLLVMSSDSLLFSFAKFLELKFYGTNYVFCPRREQAGGSDAKPAQACPHCLHPHYTQYFSFQNKVACFEIQPVEVMEVRIPPQQVTLEQGWSVSHHDYPREIKHLSRVIEGVFYRILQYLDIFLCVDVTAEGVYESKERAKAMQTNLRQKTSRLKDLTVTSGSYQGAESVNDWDKCQADLAELQDGIAGLKRSVCDAVACWNLELEKIELNVRNTISRKDPSPRESATATPLTSVEEPITIVVSTPIPSPQVSPSSKHRSVDKVQPVASAVVREQPKASPAGSELGQGVLAPPKDPARPLSVPGEDGLSHSQHKRQLSDSCTLGKVKTILEEEHSSAEERRRADLEDTVEVESAPASRRGHLRHRSLTEMMLDGKRRSSEVEDVDGELSRTLKHGQAMDPEERMDFINKLRARELETDPSKFYSLHPATPIPVFSMDAVDGEEPKVGRNGPMKKVGSSSGFLVKTEDADGGSKSAEKAKPSDPLQYLLSRPFTKLPPPFDLNEHHTFSESKLKFPVSVYDNEPMSIIAFALCSWEYQYELKCISNERKRTMGTVDTDPAQQPIYSKPVEGESSAASSSKPSGLQQFKKALYRTFQSAGMPLEETTTVPTDLMDQFDETSGEEGVKWSGNVSFPDSSHKFSSSHESLHVSMEFADDTTKFFCKVYYAEGFQRLREQIFPGGEDQFTRSLTRCVKYHAKGGKSRAMFLKTVEDRLILKQVQLVEITAFIEIANLYFKHVQKALKDGRPLVLAKILGAYSIGFRNTKTGRSKKLHVIIMENLLYGHNCERVFDLKGSMRGRYVVQDPKKQATKGDVLMDENFLEYIYNSPVYMWPHSKVVLMQAILADTQFLSNNHIMDYSLLVGLDREKGEVVVGLIDFVRPFTFDKRLEMYFKKAGRSVLPTVVYPDLYRKRFIEAMDRYFTAVPDKWTGLGSDIQVSI